MARPLRIFVICPVFGVDAERQTVESAIQAIPLSTPPEVHFSYSVPIPIPISYEEEIRSSNIILLLLTEAPSQVLRSEVACVRLPSGRLFALVSESASREAVAFVQESAAIHTRFVDTEDLKLKVVRVVSEELIAGYKQYRLPAADLTPIAALCERVEAESGQSDIAQPSPRRADIYSGASAAGPGAAFVGSENLVITGSVGGNVVINRDKVNSNASADEKSGAIPYLRLVCHVTGNLPLRGADVIGSGPDSSQRPFHLTQLFIDLDASPVVSSGGRNRSPQLSSQRPRVVSVTQVAATHPKLVLLGAPGAGKSTVVNYLAHCLGTYTLRPELYWLESRLPGWPRDCSVPIVVPLRDFTRWIVRNQSDTGRADVYHLWKFIEDRLKQQRLHAADGFLHDALDNGQALVLLDGLDEVTQSKLGEFVRSAIVSFCERFATSRYLVTCRTQSYGKEPWSLPDFLPFELAYLDEAKIRRFVSAWYTELAEQDAVRTQDVLGLTKSLHEALLRPDLSQLAPNPLLLTAMSLAHYKHGGLRDTEALLYDDILKLLLWRWEESKLDGDEDTPQLRQLLREAGRGEADLRVTLAKLAFETYTEAIKLRPTDTVADITESRLREAIAGLKQNDWGWAQRVIDSMKLRAGLMLERYPGLFSFPHRRLQEYLVASHLAGFKDFGIRAAELFVQNIVWREIILLAVGTLVDLDGESDRPLALVGELCPNRSCVSAMDWEKTLLATDVLIKLGPNRITESVLGQDLQERSLTRLEELIITGALSYRDRARAGNVLAEWGDKRQGVGLDARGVPDLCWCRIPAGPFVMGGMRPSDPMAEHTESPQIQIEMHEFEISRYPVSNAQFEAFTRDGGYTEKWRNCWTIAGWAWKSDRSAPGVLSGDHAIGNHPIVMVSWYEAVAFCKWLGQKLGARVALPKETQWEKAARGVDARFYPSGIQLTPEQANYQACELGVTTAVGMFPKGESPYGVLDMSGNVAEWCLTKWQETHDLLPQDDVEGTSYRVIKGGSYTHDQRALRCSFRENETPGIRLSHLGFRVVRLSAPN